MNEIETKIHAIVEQIRKEKKGEVSPTQDLFDTSILDSLATLEYISELEKSFDLVLPNEDLVPQNLWSIEATASLVSRHL